MTFYIGLVMPLAWVADHWNRRALVSTGLAFWNPTATAARGLAMQFWPLFGAMVPNHRRARLFGLYFVFGNPIACASRGW